MDLGTGIMAGLASAKVLEKILGPTAEYIGEGAKNFTEKRVENLNNVFRAAAKRLGSRVETTGAVPPKVLKGILDDGSFCDDPLSVDYFGGVLASSRTGIPRDDRGASIIGLLGRLSTYQIRSHYIFYHIIKLLFNGRQIAPIDSRSRDFMRVYVPTGVFIEAMDFTDDEELGNLTQHIMHGLEKEGLIDHYFRFGDTESIKMEFEYSVMGFQKKTKSLDAPTEGGIIIQPTVRGVELFLWAYGKGDLPIPSFLSEENDFPLESGVKILPGSRKVRPITPNTIKSVPFRKK